MTADKGETPAETPRETKARLAQVLEQLLLKTVEGALAAVSVEQPTASSLQAARSILSENGVNLGTLASLRGGRNPLGTLTRALPTFADDDADIERPAAGQPLSDDPLRTVQAFAPARPKDTAE